MESERWSLAGVWNAAVLAREPREIEARDRIWASELGKGVADVVLKMRGEPMSNPPNARSMRKFEAGNIFEWIVRLVLLRAGILQASQERLEHQYPGLLAVSGKLDFLAGGMPKYDSALELIQQLEMPDVLARSMNAVVGYLQEKYPHGVSSRILEVKSISSFMFDALEKTGKATQNHRMQMFHYLKCKDMPEGEIIYICRDDLRMMEIVVFNNEDTEAEYKGFIEEITRVYNSGEMPMPEPKIVYDNDVEKFAKNWNVAYSAYLTKMYGIKDQAEFDSVYQPMAAKWNRVLMRKRAGKDMTKKNLEAIDEITNAGFDFETLAARVKGASEEELEEETN